MRILSTPVGFLWDDGNLNENLKKHNFTIQEAEDMFFSEPVTVAQEDRHSTDRERRFYALGRTKTNRKLFAAFTTRENKVRIISVRDMSRKEISVYERLEKNT